MAAERSLKEKKFDRQIRLWGKHGQQNIENAHFVILGSGPAASETLKNLVLPNVGKFTIVDTATVTARDCGNNFFVTQEDIGQPRAEVVRKWMEEMNPDVEGTAITDRSVDSLTSDKKALSFFDSFTLVISCQVYGKAHERIAEYCYDRSLPYLSVRINGLLASLRIATPELTIMESHPTNDRTDFYIYGEQLENFPELNEYCNKFNIRTTDILEKPHIPCVAILVQFTKEWQTKHDGNLPKGFKEQTEFKDALREEFGDYENVDDAIHWAFQCYNPPRIDRDVAAVLDDDCAKTISKDSSEFWILVASLRDFMANEGKSFLPVSTNIPDITCDTDSYVELKRIYKARFARDLAAISSYVEKRLVSIDKSKDCISNDTIELFVRNCRSLKVVRMRSVKDEYAKADAEELEELYMDMSWMEEAADEKDDADDGAERPPKPFQPKMVEWYWAHRVCDLFFDAEGRLPGIEASTIDEDTAKCVALQKKLFTDQGIEQETEEGVLAEIARYGGCELHNQAAFLGGVAAQAAMKLILQQFYPLNHTFIHNAIFCESSVFKL